LTNLEAAQIKNELHIHFSQSQQKINLAEEDFLCPAHVFMEKLYIAQNIYGTIRFICNAFGSIELLE